MRSWYSLNTSRSGRGYSLVPLTSLLSFSLEKETSQNPGGTAPRGGEFTTWSRWIRAVQELDCVGSWGELPRSLLRTEALLSLPGCQKCWLQVVPTWVLSRTWPSTNGAASPNVMTLSGRQPSSNDWTTRGHKRLETYLDGGQLWKTHPIPVLPAGISWELCPNYVALPPLCRLLRPFLPHTWSSWQHSAAHLRLASPYLQVHFLENQVEWIRWGKLMLSDLFINVIPYIF